MSKKLKITLKRSAIGRPEDQRGTLAALGLKKLNQSIVHVDTPTIRGMVGKVVHLLEVEEVEA